MAYFYTCKSLVELVGNDELRIIEEDMHCFLRGCKSIDRAKKSDKGDYKWLCYVDYVLCKKRNIGKEFSISSNWTSKDLCARMRFELESCQGFGKGIEEDRIKAPETPTLCIQEEDEDIRAKKDTASPSQMQLGDADGGHHATPSNQDDGLFISDPPFWDACVGLVKTYEKTDGTACPGNFTP
ncbi:hypothetical protein Cgig2_027373 [Carnegiea gigantea]|uniref:Uncharacterized protein n=1 Tax=Carnegiea gigantea TaxID=171969 RepID=A0A9Q1QHY9_9CARY|nr:hypothetical protein Cgig2_027373 [Carnegiea gigantea]